MHTALGKPLLPVAPQVQMVLVQMPTPPGYFGNAVHMLRVSLPEGTPQPAAGDYAGALKQLAGAIRHATAAFRSQPVRSALMMWWWWWWCVCVCGGGGGGGDGGVLTLPSVLLPLLLPEGRSGWLAACRRWHSWRWLTPRPWRRLPPPACSHSWRARACRCSPAPPTTSPPSRRAAVPGAGAGLLR